MALMAKGGSGGDRDYSPTPAGTYQAVVFNVFDLGLQTEEFKGQSKVRHKCSIGFELVGLKYQSGEFAGQPMTKYKDYSTTIFEDKGLGGLIPVLLGRPLADEEVKNGFDLESLIGKNCTITIVHKVSQTGKTYARIANIGGLMAGLKPAEPTIPRTHLPKFIADLQAKAVKPAVQAEPVGQQMMTKEEMHWQIKDWIDSGKVKKTDVTATMRLVAKSKDWADYTHDEACSLFLKVERLAQANDIMEGTGFDAKPVIPPSF